MGDDSEKEKDEYLTEDGVRALFRLDGPPPPTLYHYTTTGGLKGLIETGKIWATDLAFLNDRHELEYGLGLVRDSILELEDGKWSEEIARFVLGLREGHEARLMVACFSEHGDQLGQWRGYAQQEGYSLGLDVERCAEVLAKDDRGERFRWSLL